MTTLIRNATIVSSNREPYIADVVLSGSKISAIGQLDRQRAELVIDAAEAYLSPGIIDVATREDLSSGLFDPERQAELLTAGITTLVCGQRGYSLVALNNLDRKYMCELSGPWRTRGRGVVAWHAFREFSKHFERHPVGVNLATFIGVTPRTLKLCATRKNREGEMLLRQLFSNVQGGALGLSVDAACVEPEELRNFLRMWSGAFPSCRHLISIHLPIDSEPAESICEAIQGEVKKTQNHFFLSSCPADRVGAKAVPQESTRYILGVGGSRAEPLSAFLPRGLVLDSPTDICAALSDPWLEKRLRAAVSVIIPENFTVRSAPHNPVFVGRTLKELGEMYELTDAASIIWQVLRSTQGQVVLEFHESDLPIEAYASPQNIFGSMGGVKLPNFVSVSNRASGSGLNLSALVATFTSRPAEALGLWDRGQIAPGLSADLVLWNNDGIRDVFVEGALAVQDGKYLGARTGRPISFRNN